MPCVTPASACSRPRSATVTCSRRCAPGGYTLGGEQSGHLVFAEHATTGDGLLTALVLLERMAATGASLADLAGVMTRLPQVLINVRSRPDAGYHRAGARGGRPRLG